MTPEGPTAGRVALVTGSGRGIGAATCIALVEQGWSIVAIDVAADDPRLPYAMATDAELAATVQACEALRSGSAHAIRADTTDVEAMSNAVRLANEEFGGLDAVVGAAGVVAGGEPLWRTDPDQIQALFDVNVFGLMTLARAAIPTLLAAPAPRDGRFIAVASSAGRAGHDKLAAYCAAKAAVGGMIRGLAHDLAGTGVTATAVSPGSTRTAMLAESARLYDLEDVEEFAVHQPIGRLMEPAEIAAVIAFVAGRSGAALSGADIAADGGMTA